MFLFLLEYLFLIMAAVLLLPALWLFDERSFKWSGFWMAASIAALATFYWTEITALVAAQGYVNAALTFVIYYVSGALITSFIYWVFYCWRVRERFDRYIAKTNLLTVRDSMVSFFESKIEKSASDKMPSDEFLTKYAQYYAIRHESSRNSLFENFNKTLDLETAEFRELDRSTYYKTVTDLEVAIAASVKSVLPPKFSICRPFVISAALEWPLTLLWLALHKVLKQIIERLVTMFKGGYDKIAKYCFGSF